MTDVAALFVDPAGIYPELLGRENCWANDIACGREGGDDARDYSGPHPVVCHSPCNRWTNFAASNYGRAIVPCQTCIGTAIINPTTKNIIGTHGSVCADCNGTGRREPNRAVVLPAWYPGGTDGGCFESALANVRRVGGCIEQPAFSHAWEYYKIGVPRVPGWGKNWNALEGNEYVCEVWQNAYKHPCRKRTWLLYCGKRPPFELRWDRTAIATHQIGFQDRRGKSKNKPTISGRAASATPRAFAEELIRLAEWSTGNG